MKKFIIIVVTILIIVIAGYFLIPFFNNMKNTVLLDEDQKTEQTNQIQNQKQTTNQQETNTMSVLGKSAGGRDIPMYQFGNGDTEILFVGGIHGGYEWNTALLAYETIDYLEANPDIIPVNVKVTVIPVLNPDGLSKTIGTSELSSLTQNPPATENTVSGRFNGNNVDLNRNFDCDWNSVGKWQDKTVSGGSEVFSEPESQAIKMYIENEKPTAVVVWYSSANGVFSSNCHNGVLAETKKLTNIYANASGYPAYEEFNFYEITGDMVNWLAKKGIPAISVLLSDHNNTEWDKNKKGIEAILNNYSTE